PVARRRDTPGQTPEAGNGPGLVGPGATRGRALTGCTALSATASPLYGLAPDAPAAAPEDARDPADLARRGSAAAAGAGDCRRLALDRSLHAGATQSAHRSGGECPALAGADRAPGVPPALGYGGASDRAHAAPVCPRSGHAPGDPCGE